MKIYLEKSFEFFFGDENKILFIYFIIIIVESQFVAQAQKIWDMSPI